MQLKVDVCWMFGWFSGWRYLRFASKRNAGRSRETTRQTKADAVRSENRILCMDGNCLIWAVRG